MAIKTFTHKDLVEIAYWWVLTRTSCGVAVKELHTSSMYGEIPDVIGFGGDNYSVLVEVKVSRNDFLSDRKKGFRKSPEQGMGRNRFYCCPAGLIKKEELPPGWGLVYVDENKKARLIHSPYGVNNYKKGQMIPSYGEGQLGQNIHAEHAYMYSVLRRLFIRGRFEEIYVDDVGRQSKKQVFDFLQSLKNRYADQPDGYYTDGAGI